jgi:hypothetical protein
LAGTAATALAQAPASSTSGQAPIYVAYRASQSMAAGERQEIRRKAASAGLKPVEDGALEREGLMVFEATDHRQVNNNEHLFTGMLRVPVQEYHGVLSVPTGNFYLRFKDEVTPTVARKRVEAMGFKVLTPTSDPGSLLVVEGTGLPADRTRELEKLNQLHELLYVAPNDIPLKVRAPSGR